MDINEWGKYGFRVGRRKTFCLAWNCNGTHLATGSQDQTIKIWKMENVPAVSLVRFERFICANVIF